MSDSTTGAGRSATPRNRPGLWIAIMAALGGLLAGAFLYLQHYQPLVPPPPSGAIVDPTGFVQWPAMQPGVTEAQWLDEVRHTGWAPSQGEAHRVFLSPNPGFTFGSAGVIRSNGWLPVTITKVRSGFDEDNGTMVPYRITDQTPVLVAPDDGSVATPKPMAFHPFSISRSSKNVPRVGVQFTVPKCANRLRNFHKYTRVWGRPLFVTYKFLWFTHAQWIQRTDIMMIVGPRDCGTPNPLLSES